MYVMNARITSLCLSILFFAQGVSLSVPLSNCGAGAITWSNATPPTCSPTFSGGNNSITIDGSGGPINLPAGGVKILADTGNITVTIQNDPILVGDNAGSQLYFLATNGKTITVNATAGSLTFNESANNTPLLVLFGGDGTIQFNINGGNTVAFNSAGGIGGTQAYVYMQTPVSGRVPTLAFNYTGNGTGNAIVQVGKQSVLSYIAFAQLDAEGIITFDPKIAASNRLVLAIANTGLVSIQGSYVNTGTVENVTLANIMRNNPSGKNSTFKITNALGASDASGLLIENNNNTLSNLQINPCCLTPNPFNGVLYGFILGANGVLDIGDNSYVDYVGLTNNQCPPCGQTTNPCNFGNEKLVKKRNASAFIVDGSTNANAVPAQINLGNCSALFFRSGVNKDGVVNSDFIVDPTLRTAGEGETVLAVEGPLNIIGQSKTTSKIEILSLQVDPTGCPLFPCDTSCTSIFPCRTFAKDQTGCFYLQYNAANFLVNNDLDLVHTSLNHTDTIHEVFQKNDVKSEPTYIGGDTFLCNNTCRPRIIFCDSRLLVQENIAFTGLDLLVPNCIENQTICCTCPTPTVSGLQCIDNTSNFIFYSNGRCCDAGTGRTMILGTQIGSMGCAGCSIISRDAHLDVMQTQNCPDSLCTSTCTSPLHQLLLQTAYNDEQFNPCMHVNNQSCADILGQNSIHTIFLGNASNITVGGKPACCPSVQLPGCCTVVDLPCVGSVCQPAPFICITHPQLIIDGNFFAFETRGGLKGLPAMSNVTGEGGIFIDQNGTISINPNVRASIATMITKSGNGIINLPKLQVLFADQVGIADWNLDLSTCQNLVILDCGACLSDYTLNWLTIKKGCPPIYCPYNPDSVTTCTCPTVLPCNVNCIPVIKGEVDQLQIQGSRLGDQAQFVIDGGFVREILFQKQGNYSGEAPIALVVLQGNGRLGLNSAHRNIDSTQAETVLGVNGITIVANGDSELVLNGDVIINNVCALLKGPNFNTGQVVRFTSPVEREFRIKSGAILDLSTFSEGDIVEFGDNVKVVVEPGAIIRGKILVTQDVNVVGPTLRLAGSVSWIHEPVLNPTTCNPLFTLADKSASVQFTPIADAALPHNPLSLLTNIGQGLSNTDGYRVKYQGYLNVVIKDTAGMFTPYGSYVGVETSPSTPSSSCGVNNTCCAPHTCLTINVDDSGQFLIGSPSVNGGSFQIGDVTPNVCNSIPNTVCFSLNIVGENATARIKSQGFLGLGIGIVDRRSSIPGNWLVYNLFNVTDVVINVVDGGFIHDRIFDSNDNRASLLAISSDSNIKYRLFIEDIDTEAQDRTNNSSILGGGNVALIDRDGSSPSALRVAVYPLVELNDNQVILPNGSIFSVHPAILASRLQMANGNGVANVTGATLFQFMKVQDFRTPGNQNSRGTAADKGQEFRDAAEPIRIGYVDSGAIGRTDVWDINDADGGTQQSRRKEAIELGAVGINVDNNGLPGTILSTNQLSS
jgi:hypothetical protein